MGEYSKTWWKELDAQLVRDEAILAEQMQWLEHDQTPCERLTQAPTDDLEHAVGRKLIAAEVTIEEAYNTLGAKPA
jgi:hypothetical protein